MKSRLRPSGMRLALVAVLVIAGAAGVTYASGAIFGGSPNDPLVVCIDDKGNVQAVDEASQCDKKNSAVKLQRFAEPQSLTVDCAAGQTVGQALADGVRNATLTITVKGTCTESVVIARDDMVLQGFAAGDGLEAPAADQSALRLAGRRIRLSQLQLAGGTFGLLATAGSRFSADAVHVTGASANGISLEGNSSGNISNSTVEQSNTGLSVAAGSSASFTGGTIRDNLGGVAARQGGHVLLNGTLVADSAAHGVIAYPGGIIELQGVVRNSGSFGAYAFGGSIVALGGSTLIEGTRFSGLHADNGGSVSLGSGARSAGNGAGVSASNGSAVLIQDGGIVENNTGSGVRLANGSSLQMSGGATIRGNGQDGIFLADVTTASFGQGPITVQGNGGWGILCAGPPAVAQVSGLESVNVSGNTAGQVRCPTAGPPFATVDCAAGQTVAAALANAPASGRYTITIKGTCTESVQVQRNDVTLRAFASGDGLAAPSAATPTVLGFNAVRGGQVDGLALAGGQQGFVAHSGSQVSALNLRITGSANSGISMSGNSVVNVSNSSIEDTQNGINVGSGGALTFAGGTVNRSAFSGVMAQPGGDVQIFSGSVVTNSGSHGVVVQHGGSVVISGSTVSNNAVFGVFAFGGDVVVTNGSTLVGNRFAGLDASDGGRAQVSGSRVVDNDGAGVSAGSGGALVIQDGTVIERNTQVGVGLTGASALRMRGGVIVRSNAGHGISLSDTSVASLGESEIVGNGGFGIHCDGAPSVAVIRGDPGNVSGNAAGQNDCPSAGG